MSKADSGAPDSRSEASSPRSTTRDGDAKTPARHAPAEASQHLAARVADTPSLARAVPQLPPQVLHLVIQAVGLEDCGRLLALTTPAQLAALFDLDLWRSARPGMDEAFDAARFGVWLEALAEGGASVAAQRLAATDPDLLITALEQYIAVFDPAVVSHAVEVDGEIVSVDTALRGGLHADVGGYMIVAKRTEEWDTLLAVLMALEEEQPDCFHRVMHGCRRLSYSKPEVDGLDVLLDAPRQARLDLAVGREQRRDEQGYVTPAHARAFLQSSRALDLAQANAPERHPLVSAYFQPRESPTDTDADAHANADTTARAEAGDDATGGPGAGARAGTNAEPDAAAHAHAKTEAGAGAESDPAAPLRAPAARDDSAAAVAAIFDVLMDGGLLPRQPRALLASADAAAPRFARLDAQMQHARDEDETAYAARTNELMFLANVLIAGCSLQGRPFTTQEAFDGAAALCNLGLENWPPHWSPLPSRAATAGTTRTLPDDFLVHQELPAVFEVGWSVLHHRVSLFVAEQLIGTLAGLHFSDREILADLARLRRTLAKQLKAGTPWHARDGLDVIAILDMPAWAALLALFGECPVTLANVAPSGASRPRSLDVSIFAFIATNTQIAQVHTFMSALPDALVG